MRIKTLAIVLAAASVSAGLVGAGWQSRSWYEDSQDLSAERARQEVLDEIRTSIASVGEQVERSLSEQTVKERVIDRGVVRETQKTVYRDRECYGPELIRLLNLGAQGGSADVSGESAAQMPGGTSDAE